MDNRMILWLEDRPKTVEKFSTYCETIGFTTMMVATAHEFLDVLEHNVSTICLILVDLMLYGISNLEGIGIENSDTSAGFDAGWEIIERLLRPSEEVVPRTYAHIPLAILSTRTATEKDVNRLSKLAGEGNEINYFEKFGLNPEGRQWEQKFKEFVNEIYKNCK